MKSIRTKLLLSIFIITLLPVYPLYHLVKNFFSQSLEVGFNENVEQALENASQFSQRIFADFRAETRVFAEQLAVSKQTRLVFQNPRIEPRDLVNFEKQYGAFYVIFYDKNTHELRQYKSRHKINYPLVSTAELANMQDIDEPQFVNSAAEPAFVSLVIPVKQNQTQLGGIVLMRPAPENFVDQSKEIIEVNQMFKAIGVLRGDLEGSFIAAFFTIYLLFVVLALALGLYFSRRLSMPLMALAEGTQK
ncbi:MAG: hypothetical protein DWQ10_08170, partial [Calditrichaeota bacterium]